MRKIILLFVIVMFALVSVAPAFAENLGGTDRTLPKPLPGHPGNVFLAGEDVVVPLPGDWNGPWRVLDYDGKVVAEGKGPGKISLDRLPVGYYEIPRGDGKPPIGIGVLVPLAAPTPKTSPIGVDSSVPWALGNRLAEAANLCALAGINWARGRLNWMEMEPKQGEFAPANKYDAAAYELNRAGIQMLQVNCLTPPWAGQMKNRFPEDLRDAYRFYREMARRWKGQVQAFEPWNEADWIQFGGHTGAEMATFQKACYWGLKAGNPDVIVCQNVFPNYFPEVIADFHNNQAWPYFDTLNFHHYWAMDSLPKYYAQFREISGGRPIWMTEGNFYHKPSSGGVGADPKTGEFTAEGLRRQAAQVPQVFAISIQGGAMATFWFILPNYREGETQFGVLRADLTPRPSYLALAAAGRLLADAKPVGRLKSANKDFWGYLFRAKPDGKEQLVLVAWSMKGTETIKLPVVPVAVFDTIGREQTPTATTLEVTGASVFGLFPVGLQNQFDYEPAATMPPRAEGKPSSVVLQAVWPSENSKSTVPWVPSSHYSIGADGPERMPIYLYNFGETEAKGLLNVAGPKDWELAIQQEVTIKPMGRIELALTYDLSQAARRTQDTVKIEGDFGSAGKAILSLRLFPRLPAKPPTISGQASAVQSPGSSKKSKGLNVLVIGHSLTGNLYAMNYFASDAGHRAHDQEHYCILGAGIAVHFKAGPRPGQTKSWHDLYFAGGQKWDALVLSARDPGSDEEYAPKFAEEALKLNPRCQIFIYGNWPVLTDSFDKPVFARTEAHIEKVGAAVDKAFPSAPKTRLMPSSLIIRELGRMADRGGLPGVASRFELFADGGDHPSRFGAYALNMMAMSMLYNEPPWNYPTDICPRDAKGNKLPTDKKYDIQVPTETAAVIKRVVWDILQTYSPAGMPPGLVIANRRLEPVIAGQPYEEELKPVHAAGPCVWSIVKGALPAGITLSPSGLISGQSGAVGKYPLTVKLVNGRDSFERLLVLEVSQDAPPTIPDQTLPAVSLDTYVVQPFKVAGGVGAVTWSLNDGKLPYGIMLSPAGMLVGTPGEAGEFTFTIKARDCHPTGPRAAEKQFTWRIGPACPHSLPVKYLVKFDERTEESKKIPQEHAIKIDGKLDEPFWNLDQRIEKKTRGTPEKRACFSAVWTANYHRYGGDRPGWYQLGELQGYKCYLEPCDLVLAVKVLDGPKGRTPGDGVHIFVDGNHNRSVVYSGDDTHFFVPRNHKGGPARSLRGKVNWFTDARVQEIEGGYTMEIRLGGNNYFGGEGNWLPFGVKGVYGLDVAVDEGDDSGISQQVWRGDANDAEDTSHFGTVVLTGQPAMASIQPEEK
ncbi:MAG: putative Ig domain-containing protein [Thermoguttaceae bacterium]